MLQKECQKQNYYEIEIGIEKNILFESRKNIIKFPIDKQGRIYGKSEVLEVTKNISFITS